jgi:hypothetical protein
MKSLKQKQRLMIILNDQSQEKTSIKQSNITTRISTNIGTNEILSGQVMSLIKQTIDNINLYRRTKQNKNLSTINYCADEFRGCGDLNNAKAVEKLQNRTLGVITKTMPVKQPNTLNNQLMRKQ